MTKKIFDYTDDLPQDEPQQQQQQQEPEQPAEEQESTDRLQRLQQRESALVEAFRAIKPDIAEAYRLLQLLTTKTGDYTKMVNSLSALLSQSFPIRFTDKDRQMLHDEFCRIAADAVTQIRRESERTAEEMRRDKVRVSLPSNAFWCLIIVLVILSLFSGLVIFANIRILHSDILTQLAFLLGASLVVVPCGYIWSSRKSKK